MVEDADAPPSPDESDQNNAKLNETISPPRSGRGRKKRTATTINTPVSTSATLKRLSREVIFLKILFKIFFYLSYKVWEMLDQVQ